MLKCDISLKKATLLVAFFILSQKISAVTGKTETYSDLIEKAYHLSLQKDRAQAVGILVSAVKKESKKGKVPKELQEALSEISQSFYSEKAQQLYETALSLRQTDPSAAISKLSEANQYDPENLLVSLEIGRNQIAKNECQSAIELGKKLKEIYPFHEAVDLMIAQSAICSGKLNEVGLMKLADHKRSEYAIHWYLVYAEYLFRKNELSQLRSTLNEAAKFDPQNPQVHYWYWKIAVETKEPSHKNAQKYVSECKKMTSRKTRDYFVDPFLCRNVAEVENFLKKNNNLQ